jgi:hypothetical protein
MKHDGPGGCATRAFKGKSNLVGTGYFCTPTQLTLDAYATPFDATHLLIQRGALYKCFAQRFWRRCVYEQATGRAAHASRKNCAAAQINAVAVHRLRSLTRPLLGMKDHRNFLPFNHRTRRLTIAECHQQLANVGIVAARSGVIAGSDI